MHCVHRIKKLLNLEKQEFKKIEGFIVFFQLKIARFRKSKEKIKYQSKFCFDKRVVNGELLTLLFKF